MRRFEQQTCVVTGAASGIGAACAAHFVELGASVLLVDIADEAGRETARRLGPSAAYCHADVASETEFEAALGQALERFGRLDCLVNNAGLASSGESILSARLDEFDRLMAVMTRGTFVGTQLAARVMVPNRSGTIVNVASVAALHVGYGTHSYSAAKAAVVQFTRSVAMELAEQNVRVNAVLPGPVATPLLARAFGGDASDVDAAFEQRLARRQPVGKVIRPEDVARAVCWLASEDSEFVIGHALVVDGAVSGGELWSRRQMRGAAARARFA